MIDSREDLDELISSGNAMPAEDIYWCPSCDDDSDQVVDLRSQGHSRAPKGSIFGLHRCANCGHAVGICVDGELNHTKTWTEFRDLGVKLDGLI